MNPACRRQNTSHVPSGVFVRNKSFKELFWLKAPFQIGHGLNVKKLEDWHSLHRQRTRWTILICEVTWHKASANLSHWPPGSCYATPLTVLVESCSEMEKGIWNRHDNPAARCSSNWITGKSCCYDHHLPHIYLMHLDWELGIQLVPAWWAKFAKVPSVSEPAFSSHITLAHCGRVRVKILLGILIHSKFFRVFFTLLSLMSGPARLVLGLQLYYTHTQSCFFDIPTFLMAQRNQSIHSSCSECNTTFLHKLPPFLFHKIAELKCTQFTISQKYAVHYNPFIDEVSQVKWLLWKKLQKLCPKLKNKLKKQKR